MLSRFIILDNLAYRNALLSQYKTIAISFERTGPTLNLDLKKSKWRCQRQNSSRWSLLKLCISDCRMESDLTRELQPCSANTDLITCHKRSQLGCAQVYWTKSNPRKAHNNSNISFSVSFLKWIICFTRKQTVNTRPTFVKNKSVINLHIAQSKGK